jgi:transcriptional regulator with XRE-family HTH domain
MTEQEFYSTLGMKFRALREKAGLTPAQVSRRIGWNRSLLMRFEEQGKKISAFRINQLLGVFGLSTIEDIFEADEDKKKVQITLSGSGLADVESLQNGEKKTLMQILATLFMKTPDILRQSMDDVIEQNIEEDRQIEEKARQLRENAARKLKANHA